MAQQPTKRYKYKPRQSTTTELKRLIKSANLRSAKTKAPESAKLPKMSYKEIMQGVADSKDLKRVMRLLQNYTSKDAMQINKKTGLAKWQTKEIAKIRSQQTRAKKEAELKAQKETVFVPGIGEVNYLGKSTQKRIPKTDFKNTKTGKVTEKIINQIKRSSTAHYNNTNETMKQNFIKAVKQNIPEVATEVERLLNDIPGTTFFEMIYKPYATELDFSFIYTTADRIAKGNEILSIITSADKKSEERQL